MGLTVGQEVRPCPSTFAEKAVPDYYADIAVFMGKLREYVKANFKEESQRRYILKTAAAEAFAEERVLTQKEIEEIIRQGPK